jgi:hypothetical protein
LQAGTEIAYGPIRQLKGEEKADGKRSPQEKSDEESLCLV